MPSFKLDMDIHEATDKLTDLFKEQVTNVTAIEMGELSRVFSFNHQQNEYVIHFKRDRYSFDKNAIAIRSIKQNICLKLTLLPPFPSPN